jgi:hypothetical protein
LFLNDEILHAVIEKSKRKLTAEFQPAEKPRKWKRYDTINPAGENLLP